MSDPKRVFDYQLELLKEELAHINGAIRQHDEMTKSIKNWAILTWTATLGVSLKEDSLRPFVAVTAIIPIVFWIVDATFRRIQRSFIIRIEEISAFVNSEKFTVAAKDRTSINFDLLVMRRKNRAFKNTLLGTMLFRSVAIFYIGLATCSVAV